MRLLLGDCLELLKTLPDNSVDSIVTDPPYGLGKEPDALKMLTDWVETGHHDVKGRGFMGKEWDAFVPQPRVWHECLRVLKPGGHLLAFAGTRTQDLMALGLRLAGFEIRDMVAWVYGSGFPKSLDVSKALDRMAGAEREVVGKVAGMGKQNPEWNGTAQGRTENSFKPEYDATAPATDAAKQWDGWGTALKPALEPITLARKPLESTVAANVLKWHTGALNIDGCRVETSDTLGGGAEKAETVCSTNHEGWDRPWKHDDAARKAHADRVKSNVMKAEQLGRWPANLIHDGSDEVVSQFPESKGQLAASRSDGVDKTNEIYGKVKHNPEVMQPRGDSGSAARFFYQAKTSKKDRNEGLDGSRTVKYTTGLCKEENMELAASLQKATCESTVRWGIDESGGSITGLCPLASLSTTLTAISKITTSEIFNSWMPLHTKESTVDANFETVNGGSHAENAEKSKTSQQATTSENQAESAHGVSGVVSKMLSSISDVENWTPATNFHATVKPTDLMRYLCRLITPPNGVILDPYMGSGSTGKAAVMEGFDFIGMDSDPAYFDIAQERIATALTNGFEI